MRIAEILFVSAAIQQTEIQRKADMFEAFSAAQADTDGRQGFIDRIVKSSWG
jgi:hypothetical protein